MSCQKKKKENGKSKLTLHGPGPTTQRLTNLYVLHHPSYGFVVSVDAETDGSDRVETDKKKEILVSDCNAGSKFWTPPASHYLVRIFEFSQIFVNTVKIYPNSVEIC